MVGFTTNEDFNGFDPHGHVMDLDDCGGHPSGSIDGVTEIVPPIGDHQSAVGIHRIAVVNGILDRFDIPLIVRLRSDQSLLVWISRDREHVGTSRL